MGRKLGVGALPPFWEGSPPSYQVRLDPSSRLVTTDMDRKLGVCALLVGGELGPHLAQGGLDQSPPPCQVPS